MVDAIDSPYVPALRKGLALLELLAGKGPMTLAQVERASGLNRTMSYRLLRLLDELGYVEHDPVRHHYALGFRLLGLGAASANRLRLAELAWPQLRALREETDETIALGVLAGQQVVFLGMLSGAGEEETVARIAGSDPPHTTSIGKAIMAFLPPRQRAKAIDALAPLISLTPDTIASEDALSHDLTHSRDRGYALEDEEHRVGVRGIGVPVLDAHGLPIAGLGLAGPAERIDFAHADRFAALLWRASREMSRNLDHGPDTLAS